jgi:hypothetical protein
MSKKVVYAVAITSFYFISFLHDVMLFIYVKDPFVFSILSV